MAERRVPARAVRLDAEPPGAAHDVVMLRLVEEVAADLVARLRCPEPGDLIGHQWWAFGFPGGDVFGNSAHGTVGEALGYGWIRLDTGSRYPVRTGFSGAGVWSPEYGAVVGMVGQAHGGNGDARAITLAGVDRLMPGEGLRSLADWSVRHAESTARTAWGWTLSQDPETWRHWRPRARGVSNDAERGHRFRGRAAALKKICGWLETEDTRGVLVVTGSPGAGKSAVLGRVVTTADVDGAASLPADDNAVRAASGSVACAVHAKGKTALDVASEIARAASALLPQTAEDLAPALRTALERRTNQASRPGFPLIIDALDEAADAGEARAIASKIAVPLAQTCADLGVRVVVGSRRRDEAGDLLAGFGPTAHIIDLDSPAYFHQQDLADYVLATLRLVGDERPANPYFSDRAARPVAEHIAELAHPNFLIAGLVARTHGLYDQEPAAPDQLTASPTTVNAALREYVSRIRDIGTVRALDALTTLAYADTPGLPLSLWRLVTSALTGTDVQERDLQAFARTAAANFLIESVDSETGGTYQLFHQALNDTLLASRDELGLRVSDEHVLTEALQRYGRSTGWAEAPAYILRSLPAHAARTGFLDDLLTDPTYLLHADLQRLTPLAARATTPSARDRERLLRLTPQAHDASPAVRAAMFGVTEIQERLGSTYRDLATPGKPYTVNWSDVSPRAEHAVLAGHTRMILALCTVPTQVGPLLASGSRDGTVRIWDPLTGVARHALQGGNHALCTLQLSGQTFLAGMDHGGAIRIWDPVSGVPHSVLEERTYLGDDLCSLSTAEGDLLACLASGTVNVWDPAHGKVRHRLRGPAKGRPHHDLGVQRMCVLPQPEGALLAGADNRFGEATITIWDPRSGEPVTELRGAFMTAFPVGDRTLLAYKDDSRTARLWDPAGRHLSLPPEDRGGNEVRRSAMSLAPVELTDRTLLAVSNSCYVWKRTGDGRGTTTDFYELQVWEPKTATLVSSTDIPVRAETWLAFTSQGRTLLAGGSGMNHTLPQNQTLYVWDPLTGESVLRLRGNEGGVERIHRIPLIDRTLLATAGSANVVHVWDPAAEEAHGKGREQRAHLAGVGGMRSIRWRGREHFSVLRSRLPNPEARQPPEVPVVDILDPASGQRVAQLPAPGRKSFQALSSLRLPENDLVVTLAEETERQPQTSVVKTVVQTWSLDTEHALQSHGPERLEVKVASYASIRGQGGVLETFLRRTARSRVICAFQLPGRALIAYDNVKGHVSVWDSTSDRLTEFRNSEAWISALCPAELHGQTALAVGDESGLVRLWNPTTGHQVASLGPARPPHVHESNWGRISELCPLRLDRGTILAATSSTYGTVKLWDLESGSLLAQKQCHPDNHNTSAIGAIAAFSHSSRAVLATGGADRMVRLWEVPSTRLLLEIPVHHPVTALAYSSHDRVLVVGSDAGLLALRPGLQI